MYGDCEIRPRDLTCLKGSCVSWGSAATHGESLRIWLCDNAAGFQVEVSDAARHREPPVDVSLARAVPRHEAAKPLYPKHRDTGTSQHTKIIRLQMLNFNFP